MGKRDLQIWAYAGTTPQLPSTVQCEWRAPCSRTTCGQETPANTYQGVGNGEKNTRRYF